MLGESCFYITRRTNVQFCILFTPKYIDTMHRSKIWVGKKNIVTQLLIFLKRNVVGINFFLRIVDSVFFRRLLLLAGGRSRRSTSSSRTKLDAIRNNLRAVFFLSFAVPTACLHTPLHQDRASLFEILRYGLCLTAEDYDVVEFG